MQDLKVLAIQANLLWEDAQANLSEFERIINIKFDHHHLIILPETFTTGFPVDPHKFAEYNNGTTVSWMRQMAIKYNTVITGSLLIKAAGKYTNTLIWMHSDGSYEHYEKRHVFTMGGEHKQITPGINKLIVNLRGWKICPMICYDLRFPVWSKNNYNTTSGFEYDLAIYIANWPAVRSYPWKILLPARAIENQAFVIGVNRVGTDGFENKYNGNSMIVDAKGKVLKQCNDGQTDTISISLSYKSLLGFRNKFNIGNDWDKFTIE